MTIFNFVIAALLAYNVLNRANSQPTYNAIVNSKSGYCAHILTAEIKDKVDESSAAHKELNSTLGYLVRAVEILSDYLARQEERYENSSKEMRQLTIELEQKYENITEGLRKKIRQQTNDVRAAEMLSDHLARQEERYENSSKEMRQLEQMLNDSLTRQEDKYENSSKEMRQLTIELKQKYQNVTEELRKEISQQINEVTKRNEILQHNSTRELTQKLSESSNHVSDQVTITNSKLERHMSNSESGQLELRETILNKTLQESPQQDSCELAEELEKIHNTVNRTANLVEVVKQHVTEGLPDKDCSDIFRKHVDRFSGVHTVQPKSYLPDFSVYCDMETDGGGWTVFQRREDGSVDFYRGWDDYKHGFGNLDGEFWLGNDKLHMLTSQGNRVLRVDMEDWEGNKKYALYDAFAIGTESTNYILSLGSYSGTAVPRIVTMIGAISSVRPTTVRVAGGMTAVLIPT